MTEYSARVFGMDSTKGFAKANMSTLNGGCDQRNAENPLDFAGSAERVCFCHHTADGNWNSSCCDGQKKGIWRIGRIIDAHPISADQIFQRNFEDGANQLDEYIGEHQDQSALQEALLS